MLRKKQIHKNQESEAIESNGVRAGAERARQRRDRRDLGSDCNGLKGPKRVGRERRECATACRQRECVRRERRREKGGFASAKQGRGGKAKARACANDEGCERFSVSCLCGQSVPLASSGRATAYGQDKTRHSGPDRQLRGTSCG
jgi:hypothetical protein